MNKEMNNSEINLKTKQNSVSGLPPASAPGYKELGEKSWGEKAAFPP